MTTEDFLGPLAALALALAIVGLFLKGTILPRNTVPREDYDKAMALSASLMAAIPELTRATNEAVAIARAAQKQNGGS